jgi:hypothetical protein
MHFFLESPLLYFLRGALAQRVTKVIRGLPSHWCVIFCVRLISLHCIWWLGRTPTVTEREREREIEYHLSSWPFRPTCRTLGRRLSGRAWNPTCSTRTPADVQGTWPWTAHTTTPHKPHTPYVSRRSAHHKIYILHMYYMYMYTHTHTHIHLYMYCIYRNV